MHSLLLLIHYFEVQLVEDIAVEQITIALLFFVECIVHYVWQ